MGAKGNGLRVAGYVGLRRFRGGGDASGCRPVFGLRDGEGLGSVGVMQRDQECGGCEGGGCERWDGPAGEEASWGNGGDGDVKGKRVPDGLPVAVEGRSVEGQGSFVFRESAGAWRRWPRIPLAARGWF